MHRNTLLFVSCLAVVAAFLVGVQVGKNLPQTILTTTPPTTPSIQPTPTIAYLSYTDRTCGVSFQYPNNIQILESTNSGTILTDPKNDKDTVLIICEQNIPRVPLPPTKIESMTLYTNTGATVSARLYHDSLPKDGGAIDKLIFMHPKTDMDVFIAGFGAVYNQILLSLKLQ